MTPEPETRDDELMGQATRCVKRFAPNGKPQMSPDDNGHITACKISDSNPNEMIASWSGDHIYSFDLVQSSDAREAEAVKLKAYQEVPANRVRRKDRKRKRQANSGTSLGEPARARMAVRGGDEDDEGELSLRVRYGNGQTQNIPLNPPSGGNAGDVVEQTRESLLSQSQKLSDRVAKALVKLRKTLFDFRTTVGQFATQNTELFTSSLGQAATLLPQMHEIMRDWRFPMDPTRGEVAFQQTLRRNRQSTYRFVQACGTLSRVLGGRLQTLDPDNDSRLLRFQRIVPAPLERDEVDASEHFAYDFLRAILLWFEGGRPALLEGFKKPPGQSRFTKRYPLDRQDEDDAIEKTLIPYLAELSSPKAIVDIDASRFEVDENRIVFSSQSHAVQSFSRAVRGYDLGWTEERGIGPDGPLQPLDRAPACRFWGVKVGRSLLMTAGEGVNYEFVNRAFGGIDINIRDRESFDPMDTERVQEEIDLNEFDEEAEAVDLIRRQPVVGDADDSLPEINMQGTTNGSEGGEQHGDGLSGSHAAVMETIDDITPSERDDVNGIAADHISGPQAAQNQNASIEDVIAEEGENRNNERAGTDTDSDEDDDVDAFESDSDDDDTAQRVVFRSSIGFGRSRQRARVESDKPCSTHTRIYKGHCNVKTVKDINFYGLDDEYIISGSDDGNFFIWDRKTTRLLNILEGDGEIVNVIQGHPYEPMIAASGIDNTVKIFSPDARMQDEARKGNNIANPGGIPESSLGLGNRRTSATSPESTTTAGLTSRRRVDQMYQIISSNDVSRQGGVGDAYLTRSMLARIAASINRGQGGLGQGGQIVIDDNCTVM
ncbi:putative wd repeat-containing protein [Phaeomoniella chlamydospora]|uniref:Putative wd repeat-containing protein n=1 Tax=Phaeomoniella chlamydospora TaxID=158046 RepID=A0A0G2E6Z9_PHACM|nr:putative wd repeat-containing protein [Phaeomoniella chlamydospora]